MALLFSHSPSSQIEQAESSGKMGSASALFGRCFTYIDFQYKWVKGTLSSFLALGLTYQIKPFLFQFVDHSFKKGAGDFAKTFFFTFGIEHL
jgi:hypothetical protein